MSPRCCAARYSGACPHYLPLTVSPPRVSWADCAPRVTALVCAPRRVRGGGAGQGRARSHEWAHFYCSQPSPAQPSLTLCFTPETVPGSHSGHWAAAVLTRRLEIMRQLLVPRHYSSSHHPSVLVIWCRVRSQALRFLNGDGMPAACQREVAIV